MKRQVCCQTHPAPFEQVLQTEASHKGREQGAPLVVLDGAHTPPSLGALALTLRAAFPDNPLALVVAMARCCLLKPGASKSGAVGSGRVI